MIKGLLYISAVGLFLLSGCGSKNKIACSDENGLLALKNVVTEATEKQLRSENSNLTLSSIRATIAKIGMSFEDIRTSKNDPNSNKVFCESKLTLSIPTDLLSDIQVALEESGQNDNIEKFLTSFNYKKSATAANKYQIDLVYNLQPTDDGKQIYSEIEDSTNAVAGISSMLNYALSKNIIINQNLEEKRAKEEIEKQEAAYHRSEWQQQSFDEMNPVQLPETNVSSPDEIRPTDEMSVVQ